MKTNSDDTSPKVLITGANGHVGHRLINALAPTVPVIAMVRSSRACTQLQGLAVASSIDIRVVSYSDAQSLKACVEECTHIVHLVGIIKESSNSSFVEAHEQATAALLAACEGSSLQKLVHLSLLGADPESSNRCFASRGRTEELLMRSAIKSIILRVPMVLGEGDYATAALKRRGNSNFNLVFRASSLDQPLYVGDLISAVKSALFTPISGSQILELAGPECLTRRELIHRVGELLGTRPHALSLPIGIGYLVAGLLERLLPNPPFSKAMLGVLDHDDQVDTEQCCRELKLQLTPLDDALRSCLTEP